MAALLLDISVWSADLANLESELRRLETVADSFHFDACDGHFVPSLLFFPDLIARLRQVTSKEFHLHLMATRPMDLLSAFLDAGVNRVTLPLETGKRVSPALDFLLERGIKTGISIDLETPPIQVKDYAPRISRVLHMGTRMGIKGCDLDLRACGRIEELRRLFPSLEVFADGGIREQTVPPLRQAGAHGIVPGSLVCAVPDVAARAAWLKSL
jgi:ribulose-phosphate 3-epimerase